MAKKKATHKKAPTKKAVPKKKAVKKAKVAKTRRGNSVKPPAKKAPSKVRPAKPMMKSREYGQSFFLTANSDTDLAYEIDGTPHPKTVLSYRMEQADILEYEEQDGKILYKVKPLKSPAG
jgi:hypothetical protein